MEGIFVASDGAHIPYLYAGNEDKPVLLMIPGWSQSVYEYHNQYTDPILSSNYRIIAIGYRTSTYGNKVDRIAQDIREFILYMDISGIVAIGHSLGASVLWNYVQNYGTEYIDKFIFIDQPPVLLRNPLISDREALVLGTTFDTEPGSDMNIWNVYNSLKSDEGDKYRRELISSLFNESWVMNNPLELEWILGQNDMYDKDIAADLIYDHITKNWLDIMPSIDVPVLIVAATNGLASIESQMYMHDIIPDSEIYVFEEGSHFMFYESPEEFNAVIHGFIVIY